MALNLATEEQLAGSLCKRHAVARRASPHCASTACRHVVSGSISLPLKGFFSPFPRGTCALSVTGESLALEGGPPRFTRDFTCPALLRYRDILTTRLHLQGFHLLWPAFPGPISFSYHQDGVSADSPHPALQPPHKNSGRITSCGFGPVPFRSPLLRDSH